MEQIIVGGEYYGLNQGATAYNCICGAYAWNTDEDDVAMAISTAGKLKNLRVELNDSPGAGKSYTFTLYLFTAGAWGDTALTLTIANGATSGYDTAHEVTVAAGDVVCLKCAPSGTPTIRYARWTMMFEGDTAKESLLFGSMLADADNTRYMPVNGHYARTTENDVRVVCPTSGTIKNLYVQLEADPGSDPDAYRFTLRVNGANSDDGEGNPLQCTITANDKTGNDTTHEITVSAGDVLTLMIEPLNSPSQNNIGTAIGMTFVADTDGESLLLGGSADDLSNSATEYNYLNGSGAGEAWTATEAQTYQLAQECTFKKLYVLLSGSPGTDNSYTFTVRQNGASPASGLVVAISDAATTGNDTANTISISDDDEVDMMVVPADTPTVRDAYWGLVCFISGAVDVTIEPPCATVDAAGLIPTLSLDVIFSITLATADATAPAPTFVLSHTIEVPLATIDASALAPVIWAFAGIVNLTPKPHTYALTLQKHTYSLTLKPHSYSLTVEKE